MIRRRRGKEASREKEGEGRSPGARSAPLRTQSAEAARRAAGLRPVPGFFVDLRRRI